MAKHAEHTPEQRAEIVLALLRREEPASVLARRHGISENTLYRWREEFIAGGRTNMASSKKAQKLQEQRTAKLEREIAERDMVIGELTIANRILKKNGRPHLDEELRDVIMRAIADESAIRLVKVLDAIGIPRSSWYHQRVNEEKRKSKGPAPDPIPDWMESLVCFLANLYPMWGYKRIAVICRKNGYKISNKKTYRIFKEHKLLNQPKPRDPAVYQAAKLFELLPQRPNDLWQTDVTYIHVPGHGWWYAVTVIDYYSRYLLACHLTHSYSAAECTKAIDIARARAEGIHGPLERTPFLVTDNGSSFMAHAFQDHIAGDFSHVRIQYRTPTQLGLLERFHQTLKAEEVYYRIYKDPGECRDCLDDYRDIYNRIRPHWALKPEGGGDPLTPDDVYRQKAAIGIPKWQGWARAAKKKLAEMLSQDQEAA